MLPLTLAVLLVDTQTFPLMVCTTVALATMGPQWLLRLSDFESLLKSFESSRRDNLQNCCGWPNCIRLLHPLLMCGYHKNDCRICWRLCSCHGCELVHSMWAENVVY